MTFEEFFRKKKIDLHTLRQEQEDLYEEFRIHYAVMGEKSFDHTKKYWFNKLRRLYPLREEPSAIKDTNPNPEKAYQPLFRRKPD